MFPPLSTAPIDVTIRDMVGDAHAAADGVVAQVIAHVSTATFDDRTGSLSRHLSKRIEEGQWAPGTPATDYLDHLRRAAERAAGVALYSRRGGVLLLFVAKTESAVPEDALGSDPQPNIAVIYSADRGRIITGYQFSSIESIDVPADAIWLRRLDS